MFSNIIIGAPVCRHGSYAFDKFLSNQSDIQLRYPSSELILATSEKDFLPELNQLTHPLQLKVTIIHYEVTKPVYAQSNLWDIAAGREAIRQYVQLQTKAKYLLFLDSDMIFDPSVVEIMDREVQGYDAAFSGYPLRHYGIGLAGAGCMIINRNTLEKLNFRCLEFKNGEVIFEDNVLEYDLFRLHCRVKKGFFLHIAHHVGPGEVKYIAPQPTGFARMISNTGLFRYMLIRTSIAIHYNIPWRLKVFINKIF